MRKILLICLGATCAFTAGLSVVNYIQAQPIRSPSRNLLGGAPLGGSATNNINMSGYYIYDSTGAMDMGSSCSSTHSLATGDVLVCDDLEVNGVTYLDGTTTLAGTVTVTASIGSNNTIGTTNTGASSIFSAGDVRIGSDDGYTWSDNVGATSSADTGVWRDSAGAVAFSNGDNTYGEIVLDASAFIKGQRVELQAKVESVTFAANPGNASKTTSTTMLPDGSRVLYVTGRVTTAGTNCAGFSVGISGGDVDLWGANVLVAQNTTFTTSGATAQWNELQLADGEITITGTDGAGSAVNCFDLVVAITSVYQTSAAATVN